VGDQLVVHAAVRRPHVFGTRRSRRRWRVSAIVAEPRVRLTAQPALAAVLMVLAAAVATGVALVPAWFPPSAMLLVLLLALTVLRFVPMLVLVVFSAILVVSLTATGATALTPGVVLVLAVGAIAGLGVVRSRERLGLAGAPSRLMLVDLRDRLTAHGRIPPLPPGWEVDSVVRSAHGEAFSGDFVVAASRRDGLEIVLVDVSGKGQEAGVRSLLLSGAFGGLLGAMPPREFLPAANAYLLGQEWPEGFATAVHLTVDLVDGRYWISHAGHPPAVHLHAGSGVLKTLDRASGPALGVVADPTYAVHEGTLEPGDTLMLYTDGLVESPGQDVALGIDRLMGVAERVVATRRGGAKDVVAGVRAGEGDDRALILVRRV
jgi:hypothetical protein